MEVAGVAKQWEASTHIFIFKKRRYYPGTQPATSHKTPDTR